MGVPGWPELASSTASIDSVRIVSMQRVSSEQVLALGGESGAIGIAITSRASMGEAQGWSRRREKNSLYRQTRRGRPLRTPQRRANGLYLNALWASRLEWFWTQRPQSLRIDRRRGTRRGRDHVPHPGLPGHEEANALLDILVCTRNSGVLAFVLDPGFDVESLHESSRLLHILENAPPIRAVAAPFGGLVMDGREKSIAVASLDLILDRHHDRARIVRDRLRHDRRGPVHGRRKVDPRALVELPPPGERYGEQHARGGDVVREGKPRDPRHFSPHHASQRHRAEEHGHVGGQ